jgi:hypothetical protein
MEVVDEPCLASLTGLMLDVTQASGAADGDAVLQLFCLARCFFPAALQLSRKQDQLPPGMGSLWLRCGF